MRPQKAGSRKALAGYQEHTKKLFYVLSTNFYSRFLQQNKQKSRITKSLFRPGWFAVRSTRAPTRSRLPPPRRRGRADPTRRCRQNKSQTRTSTSWMNQIK